ncbi:hypothetical protein XENTR_v10017685 [Xenopus tropicalis]|nr:hypothetical protein XENTR_v10017685 [Xenopus tropicalis]
MEQTVERESAAEGNIWNIIIFPLMQRERHSIIDNKRHRYLSNTRKCALTSIYKCSLLYINAVFFFN